MRPISFGIGQNYCQQHTSASGILKWSVGGNLGSQAQMLERWAISSRPTIRVPQPERRQPAMDGAPVQSTKPDVDGGVGALLWGPFRRRIERPAVSPMVCSSY